MSSGGFIIVKKDSIFYKIRINNKQMSFYNMYLPEVDVNSVLFRLILLITIDRFDGDRSFLSKYYYDNY
jgi:hypothetical protein